jgi:hypothetical protein
MRFRETRGTSWRGANPGTRHWQSSSVSYGLGTGFIFAGFRLIFIGLLISFWYPTWMAIEMCVFPVSLGIALIRASGTHRALGIGRTRRLSFWYVRVR